MSEKNILDLLLISFRQRFCNQGSNWWKIFYLDDSVGVGRVYRETRRMTKNVIHFSALYFFSEVCTELDDIVQIFFYYSLLKQTS